MYKMKVWPKKQRLLGEPLSLILLLLPQSNIRSKDELVAYPKKIESTPDPKGLNINATCKFSLVRDLINVK